MKILAAITIPLMLSGCAAIQSWIPSFWDDNQSAKITDVRQSIAAVTCEPGTQLRDSQRILADLEWFELYSESKGQRQQDVRKIIQPIQETVRDWRDRSHKAEGSRGYCLAKKKILEQQAQRAAAAILGRF